MGWMVLRWGMLPCETRCIGAGEERGRQGWLGPSEGRVTGLAGPQGARKELELMRMKMHDGTQRRVRGGGL